MKKVTDGVVDVIVYPSAADKSKNRGFAFVEYESHRAAAMARRKLLPGTKPNSNLEFSLLMYSYNSLSDFRNDSLKNKNKMFSKDLLKLVQLSPKTRRLC